MGHFSLQANRRGNSSSTECSKTAARYERFLILMCKYYFTLTRIIFSFVFTESHQLKLRMPWDCVALWYGEQDTLLLVKAMVGFACVYI